MQSKLFSFFEAWTNTIVGFATAYVTQVIVFPFYGIYITVQQDLQIVFIFACVSIVRSYVIRRIFNKFKESK